jgi:hypothetical protein
VDLKATRAVQRQAAALCLGHIQYRLCPESVSSALMALLVQLQKGTKVGAALSNMPKGTLIRIRRMWRPDDMHSDLWPILLYRLHRRDRICVSAGSVEIALAR